MLIEIIKITFGPSWHFSEWFRKLFINEYNTHLTSKHHMITHLLTVIKRMDPLRHFRTMKFESRHFRTMKFESKHGYLNDLSRKLKNYKSVCKIFAFCHQQVCFLNGIIAIFLNFFFFLRNVTLILLIESTTYFHTISKLILKFKIWCKIMFWNFCRIIWKSDWN